MIRTTTKGGLALAVILLAACQTNQPAPRVMSAMDGNWASTDGVFVATFQEGQFTSRYTRTNEVLAQGTYTVSGSTVNMQWLSVQAQEQRSAACTLMSPESVSCNQAGGGTFGLQRSA